MNSFQRVVRSRVHQVLARRDGRERGCGGFDCRRQCGEGRGEPLVRLDRGRGYGRGGTSQFLSLFLRLGQSASCQRGLCLSLWWVGGADCD